MVTPLDDHRQAFQSFGRDGVSRTVMHLFLTHTPLILTVTRLGVLTLQGDVLPLLAHLSLHVFLRLVATV